MRRFFTLFLLFHSLAILSQSKHDLLSSDSVIIVDKLPVHFTLNLQKGTPQETNHLRIVINTDTLGFADQIELVISKEARIQILELDTSGYKVIDKQNIIVGNADNNGLNRIPIRNGKYLKFMSGMNIAWRNFANDLDEWTEDDEVYFGEIMDSIQQAGGNAIRWWLHTNGAKSPNINSNGYVEGINFEAIQAMKHMLDMAYDHGIMVSMCLWTHNMLQNQEQDRNALKLLLTDTTNIRSYIDNALIPILEKIGDHPAVMTWEIFNEAEGMSTTYGWTAARIQMRDVQVFVNMLSGAIHRIVPGAQVSNGVWNLRANTDIGSFRNYYSDEELIAAGGDPLGYLDFYQIHYYAEYFDNGTSPFHHPASYWELDKPILIGETWADTICCRSDPDLSIREAFERTVEYGYAGLMTWSWTDRPDFGPTSSGIKRTVEMLPGEIEIPQDENIDRSPINIVPVPSFRIFLEDIQDTTYLALEHFFVDEDAELLYAIASVKGDQVSTPVLLDQSKVNLSFTGITGHDQVTFNASDMNGWYTTAHSIIMVGSKLGHEANLAYFKTINATSSKLSNHEFFINDDDLATKWVSQNRLNDTINVDLGEEAPFNFSAIHWGNLSFSEYQYQTSNDLIFWNDSYDQNHSRARIATYARDDVQYARYHRLILKSVNNTNNFEINEIIIEHVENNQSPIVLMEIPNVKSGISQVRTLNNYAIFEDVFSDLEHKEYLTYRVENSNEALLEVIEKPNGITLFFFDQIGNSTITLTAIDPFGASVSTSFNVEIYNDLLSTDEDKFPDLHIYPNPTHSTIEIALEKSKINQVELWTLEGKLLQSINEINTTTYQCDLSNIHSGHYLLRVVTVDGHWYTTKVIKE